MKFSTENLFKVCSRPTIHVIILILITLVITTKDISNGEFREADGFSHGMNGVFICDFVKDMPIQNAYEYALKYYARYPSITIPYHPPVFPLFEAVFYFLFGISTTTARFTVVFFSLVAIFTWYHLIRSKYDKGIAFFSAIFFITAPKIVFHSRAVMLEMPSLSIAIVTIYFFHRAIDLNKLKNLIPCATLLGISLWTKQTTCFLVPLFICYIIFTKKIQILISKEAIISIIIFLLISIPLVYITYKFANYNITQATVSPSTFYGKNYSFASRFLYYIKALPWITGLPVLILSILSLLFLVIKNKLRLILFSILWIILYYALLTYISVKEVRYAFYLIPPICLIAAMLLNEIKLSYKNIRLSLAGYIILSIFTIINGYNVKHEYIKGYEEAAKYIIKNSKSISVLVCAYYHGNLIFNIRKHDKQKQIYVLRGEKILPEIYTNPRIKKHGYNKEDIYPILEKYGIKYVVMENKIRWERPQIKRLINVFSSKDFTLRKKINLSSNISDYNEHAILIYEFNKDVNLKRDYIEIDIPKMGKTIKIPINDTTESQ